MPVVIVEMWEGRTLDQKKKLVKGLTDAFVGIGTSSEKVQVIIHELPRDCFGHGGKLDSET
jgi:4-oxalocrotonate tautomerase